MNEKCHKEYAMRVVRKKKSTMRKLVRMGILFVLVAGMGAFLVPRKPFVHYAKSHCGKNIYVFSKLNEKMK